MVQICRAFMQGRRHPDHPGRCPRDDCSLVHNPKVCRFLYFRGRCRKGDDCSFLHQVDGEQIEIDPERKDDQKQQPQSEQRPKKRNNRKKRPKNTENFKPSHEPPALRVQFDFPQQLLNSKKITLYPRPISARDVIVAQGLFSDLPNVYQTLLDELKATKLDPKKLWKSWHGDSHLIADDHLKWKESCPTFNLIIERVRQYFQMDVQATRFNWYRDSSEWKPFHHDAAAIKPEIAKKQNFTVGISFGLTREAGFEHAKSKEVVSIPQPDGSIYAFAHGVNCDWKHGILQYPPDQGEQRQLDQGEGEQGRISIIAWGWVSQTE